MLNAIGMDLRRTCISKKVLMGLFFMCVITPAAFVMILEVIGNIINSPFLCDMNCFRMYSGYAGLYLACMVTYFLNTDVEEGILRNKIISGKNRVGIFASYCIVNGLIAVVMQILSVLVVAITGTALGMEMDYGSLTDLFRYSIVASVAGASLCVLFVAMFLSFCHTKVANVLPTVFSVLMMLVSGYVLDKLYPQNGVCMLQGVKLQVFQFLDRYVPYFYLSGDLRQSLITYFVGCIGTVLVALIIGCVVFSRKNLR